MAIFHCSISIATRAQGASSVAAAAYISRSALQDQRTGRRCDYRRCHLHERLVADLGVTLPPGAPERWRDRSTLWNEVEAMERGPRAQLCRKVEVALPVELDEAQRLALAREIVEYFASQGMVVDACLHDATDSHNPHLHMVMPLRACDGDGFLPKAKNVYLVRDHNGRERWMDAAELAEANKGEPCRWEKVYRWQGSKEPLTPSEAAARGLTAKRSKVPLQRTRYLVDWNDRSKAETWRHDIAHMENEALAAAGHSERVDHRSYARQGSERIPTSHEGPGVTWAERRGAERDRSRGRRPRPRTARRMRNMRVRRRNRRYRRLLHELLYLLERYEREQRAEILADMGARRGRGYGRYRTPGRARSPYRDPSRHSAPGPASWL